MEHPRISQDPKVRFGKPVIKGTRITVEQIIGMLDGGWSVEEIVDQFPHLSVDDISAARSYALDKRTVTAAE